MTYFNFKMLKEKPKLLNEEKLIYKKKKKKEGRKLPEAMFLTL